jgi:hypothetical protein
VLGVWLVHKRYKPVGKWRTFGAPFAALVIVASSFAPEPVFTAGLILVALVIINTYVYRGVTTVVTTTG